MKHNVILVVLDGLNYEVSRHALGHLQAYCGAGRAALYKLECELPSLSRPLYECIMTGVAPIDSGIVHNDVVRRMSAASSTMPVLPVCLPRRRLITGSASCITARPSMPPATAIPVTLTCRFSRAISITPTTTRTRTCLPMPSTCVCSTGRISSWYTR